MRFVTLNLGIGEAAALRHAVEGALGTCSCREGSARGPCNRCAELVPIRNDLNRFLAPGPDRPLLIDGDGARLAGREGLSPRESVPITADLRRRLWVVPPATADI